MTTVSTPSKYQQKSLFRNLTNSVRVETSLLNSYSGPESCSAPSPIKREGKYTLFQNGGNITFLLSICQLFLLALIASASEFHSTFTLK